MSLVLFFLDIFYSRIPEPNSIFVLFRLSPYIMSPGNTNQVGESNKMFI